MMSIRSVSVVSHFTDWTIGHVHSGAGEFVYDRPFLWGSKRTGPDLYRIGDKYTDDWHRLHLLDIVPRAVESRAVSVFSILLPRALRPGREGKREIGPLSQILVDKAVGMSYKAK